MFNRNSEAVMAKTATPRKPRSDKGLVREVTRIKNLVRKFRKMHPLKSQAESQFALLEDQLEALDGRMKVRFDPSSEK